MRPDAKGLRVGFLNPARLIPKNDAERIYRIAVECCKSEVNEVLERFYHTNFSGKENIEGEYIKRWKSYVIFVPVKNEKETVLANLLLPWAIYRIYGKSDETDMLALYLLREYGAKYYSEQTDKDFNPLAWPAYRRPVLYALDDFKTFAGRYKSPERVLRDIAKRNGRWSLLAVLPEFYTSSGEVKYYVGVVVDLNKFANCKF